MGDRLLERKRALDIIGNFRHAKVLVVGDIMADQFIWGKVSRISPEAPVPVVRVTSESYLLGGCTNVVNNIFTAGGKAAVSGVIGADALGNWIAGELSKRDIDTGGLVIEEGRPTIVKTRIVAHGQQVVRFDREVTDAIRAASTRRIVEYVKGIRDEIGAIVISDYSKGVVTRRLVNEIRKAIRGEKIVLCVDPKQDGFSLYRDCDVITPNHHEAGRALGREFTTAEDVIRGGKTLVKKFNFRAVLITRGEEGMTLFERTGDMMNIPTKAKEVYDVTGAGDTVIGIFALAAAAGATLKEAAMIANMAAGIVVGKVGTATVTQQELKRVFPPVLTATVTRKEPAGAA